MEQEFIKILLRKINKKYFSGYENGKIYEYPEQITKNEIVQKLGGEKTSSLVGFITYDSEISTINIQITNNNLCKQGALIWCKSENSNKVFYQINNGVTNEESFHKNKYGFQVANAVQLGTLSKK